MTRTPSGRRTPRVVVDAMGGDHGPYPVVAGALEAARHGADVVLVGRRDALAELVPDGDEVPVVASGPAVAMDADPVAAVRSQPDASINVAVDLLRRGAADALVSAGSTGASIVACHLALPRRPGIRRSAMAAVLPVTGPGGADVIMVDTGAQPDAGPRDLVGWAGLGCDEARRREVATPRVGLLNVGAEPRKGSTTAREAHPLLAAWAEGPTDTRFVGNVEPADVLEGAVDVVVTDAVTGNIFVKTVEWMAARATPFGAGRAGPPPGGLLLGHQATVVVAHGTAGPAEITTAVRTAVISATADASEPGTSGTSGTSGARAAEPDGRVGR